MFSGGSENVEAVNAFAKDQVTRANKVLANLPQLNGQPILELAEVPNKTALLKGELQILLCGFCP